MPIRLPSIATSSMHGAVFPIAYATPSNSSVTFTNIPQVFQDLMLVVYGRDSALTGTVRSVYFGFNGVAVASSYTWTEMNGARAKPTSSRSTSNQFQFSNTFGTGITTNMEATSVYHMINYTNTSAYKTVISQSAADYNTAGNIDFATGLWQNTAAISEINLRNTWQTGSTIALYGIRTVGQ